MQDELYISQSAVRHPFPVAAACAAPCRTAPGGDAWGPGPRWRDAALGGDFSVIIAERP